MDEKLVKYTPHAHTRCSVSFGVSVTEHEVYPLYTNLDLHDKFELTYHVAPKLGFSLYYLLYIANHGVAPYATIRAAYSAAVPMDKSLVKMRLCFDAKGVVPNATINSTGLKVKNTLCTLLGAQSIKHAQIFNPERFAASPGGIPPNIRYTDKILLWGRTVMFALGLGPFGWDACTLLKALPARLRDVDVLLMDDNMRFALDDAAKKAQYAGIDDIMHGGAGWWFMGYRIVDIDVHAHLRATSRNPLGIAELIRLHNNNLALYIPPPAEIPAGVADILASWDSSSASPSSPSSPSATMDQISVLTGGLERIRTSKFPHVLRLDSKGVKINKIKNDKLLKVAVAQDDDKLIDLELTRIFTTDQNAEREMSPEELLDGINNGNIYTAHSRIDGGVEVKPVHMYGVAAEDEEIPADDTIVSVHGGKMEAYKVDLGKETDYLVKSLMLRLKHNKKNLFVELDDKLVTELLGLATDKFIYKFMNISKMTWIYALAARPLFFEIVHWLEGLISRACKERDFDIEGNLIKWKRIDREEGIDSSSIVLYRFDEISQKIGFEYLGQFKYPGFCPWEPDVRLRKLMDFPLTEWLEWLERFYKNEMIDIQIQLDDMKEFIKKITITAPPTFTKIKYTVDRKVPIREALLQKVLAHQGNLKLWEDYLVAWTKIMSSLTARWMTTVVAQTNRAFD
jgi:hypothetical protein